MNTQRLVVDAKIHHEPGTRRNARTLEFLCNVAVTNGYTHMWVHANAGIKIGPEGYEQLGPEWQVKPNWYIKKEEVASAIGDNTLVSLVGRKQMANGLSHRFNIIFLDQTRWGWDKLSPEETLELITRIESRLGIALTGSPANAGMNYLQKVLSEHHPKWLARPETDLSIFRFTKPLVWNRIPSADELQAKYLYSVDKNSAWPRAAKAEKFGVGEPTHFTGRCEFDAKLPGMWKIDVLDSPDIDERLPHPLHRIDGLEWLPTAIVKLLVSMGCVIEVKEAYVFKHAEYVFKRWVENLWDFRCEFPDGSIERSSIKKIMNEGCGITGSSLVTDSFKNRPDFAGGIISASRAVMYYNILKYAKLGYYPVLVQTDEIFYLSSAETIEEAVPGIIGLKDSLGGYKLKYRIPLDGVYQGQTIREILASNRGQTYKKQACNAVAGEVD